MAAGFVLKDSLQERLKNNYTLIRNTETVNTGILNFQDIAYIQDCLNDAQPQRDEDGIMQKMFQFLYRRNPVDFNRFLMTNKLYYMLLWTEAKRIVMHFRLNRLIHIKWDGVKYVCSEFITQHNAQHNDASADPEPAA